MYRLKQYIKHFKEKYHTKLNSLETGEQIDDEKYTKHLYWELGFMNGVLHGIENIEDIIKKIEEDDI